MIYSLETNRHTPNLNRNEGFAAYYNILYWHWARSLPEWKQMTFCSCSMVIAWRTTTKIPTKKPQQAISEIQYTNKIRNGIEWEKYICWGQNQTAGRIYSPVLISYYQTLSRMETWQKRTLSNRCGRSDGFERWQSSAELITKIHIHRANC